MENKTLQFQQLNNKISGFENLKHVIIPTNGWIKTIRATLGMTMQQLGNKLLVSKQGILDMENREKEGAITIKSLKEIAKAMDMQLVYGFVPNDGTLDALVKKRATALATKIVMRAAATMKLENQANSEKRIKKAIQERANKIINEMPKVLWD
ncbi:MAG: mobile mystery protein A [bacterium]|nr:mobile mystery protein A [bacterium]